jgi:hypothetical protein
MDTTTTENSSHVTDFLKEKTLPVLCDIIGDIKENTRHSMNAFIRDEKKFKGIPATLIPD